MLRGQTFFLSSVMDKELEKEPIDPLGLNEQLSAIIPPNTFKKETQSFLAVE